MIYSGNRLIHPPRGPADLDVLSGFPKTAT